MFILGCKNISGEKLNGVPTEFNLNPSNHNAELLYTVSDNNSHDNLLYYQEHLWFELGYLLVWSYFQLLSSFLQL